MNGKKEHLQNILALSWSEIYEKGVSWRDLELLSKVHQMFVLSGPAKYYLSHKYTKTADYNLKLSVRPSPEKT